ncbi:LD-carboxypeptidase [Mitsuaria sp. WAJ17]|uniref:S66 peptidase family protein n=1 Tax=Mitsuaria sp. WAJ17 TaxID=2761452 RepID=UPI001603A629|nr:LD-carboxypeptidase [Mitsuaria sp. WAJ17]MBB2483893.1 LD-carboxypeptidase [Mitsuaria sp. WAJ17]
MDRRHFLQASASLGPLATMGAASARPDPGQAPLLRPRRLRPGDTIGLISPANASFEREPVALAIEALQALGLQVKLGAHALSRRGQFGGSDAERADDIHRFFADDGVAGLLALTGGSGCARIVDQLDYGLIRQHPKFFGGFSDVTCLINAIHRQTGLLTFHSPFAGSTWTRFTTQHFRALVMEGEAPLLRNPVGEQGGDLVQAHDRAWTLRGGRARGRLVGGNLAVLSAMAGSAYFPDFDGAVLFLEDINEYIYRIDRMLATLRLAGALRRLAGVVLGQFTRCEPGDGNYGTLTLDEVFEDYFGGLGVPVYRGAMIGHIPRKFTLPIGAEAEIDADACSLRILMPAVA